MYQTDLTKTEWQFITIVLNLQEKMNTNITLWGIYRF